MQIASVPVEWISEPVAADVTISGTVTANLWAFENSMTDNAAINVIIDIIRATDNAIVQIVKSTRTTELATTAGGTVQNFTTGMTSGAYTAQTLNRGDRLRIRVFIDDAGTMAANAIGPTSFYFDTVSIGSSGDSYVTFTENITFESGGGVGEVASITQSSAADGQANIGTASFQAYLAQSFTALGPISRVELWLSKGGTPTDNVIVELQSDASGVPSGTVLASQSMSAASLSAVTPAWWSFALSYATTPSTLYWIVLSRSGAFDGANVPRAGRASNLYAGGSSAVGQSGPLLWIEDATKDLTFIVYQPVSTRLYLTDTASAVATASVDREAWTSRGSGVVNDVTNTAAGFTTPRQVTDTAGGTVVDWFTRPLQAVTLTGLAEANIRALESAIAANASLRVEIARVAGDGTSPTVWASWCASANNGRTGELNTAEAAETVNVSGDDLAITNGQRLRIRLYIDDMPTAAMGASQTVTTYYGGTSAGASGDTYITFPVTLTEYATGPFVYTDTGAGVAGLVGSGASAKVSGAAPGPVLRRQRRASRFLTFR